MDEMKRLVELLNEHAIKYYVYDNPTISDKEYDALYDKLARMEKDSGIVLDNSPTKRVGGQTIKEFSQHSHIAKLYSLDKAQTVDEMDSFFNKIDKRFHDAEYTLEYKFDGLTLNLTYENGKFVMATTRGNGEVGEDVTAQVLTIRSFPLNIDCSGTFEIQGEGIMRKSVFEKYNRTAKEPLKNPRNGVAGAIRNLDSSITASRRLDIMFYNVGYNSENKLATQKECYEFLKRNNFKTSDFFLCTKSRNEIKNKIKDINENRDNLDFMIDGVVIKLNKFDYREKLGYTEKFPRWALAYKFEAEEVTTILDDVIWNVGRTGKLTPLGVLQPVELSGATIRRATLNNMGDIGRKGVAIGSRVLIRRSNDVIPEILAATETHDDDKQIFIPNKCPSCGSHLEFNGAHVFCNNKESCKMQIIARIAHFASKDAMDIDGFSEKTATILYEKLNVRHFSDLYKLSKDKLISLDKIKDKKAENLLEAIETSKNTELYRFLHAICIPNVGKKTAKQLASQFGSLEAVMRADYDSLVTIDDVGEIMASSIQDYFHNSENVQEVQRLVECGIVFKSDTFKSGIFSGHKVVLTGSLNSFTRDVASKIIEDNGGEVVSSVTNDTTLVIAGEKAGSKLNKAKDKGVKVIFEEEFRLMIENV